jgi:hypothetical protein
VSLKCSIRTSLDGEDVSSGEVREGYQKNGEGGEGKGLIAEDEFGDEVVVHAEELHNTVELFGFVLVAREAEDDIHATFVDAGKDLNDNSSTYRGVGGGVRVRERCWFRRQFNSAKGGQMA